MHFLLNCLRNYNIFLFIHIILNNVSAICVRFVHILNSQHNNVIPPLSAPNNSNRLRGRTVMAVRTPLKASDLNLDEENEAVISTAV